ncbi:SGNH/GDSL hydrolase family protein [Rugosimonospora africana]|uniref:SGNH hydrolase n=1 Tax=Rugosimonospora africana TaxID=556532 RepID=A0A8J3QNI3_9ACTN|nr:SGNH/GDSL hydrolase family protein [Rugosimonospora africana]GIH12890.1 SGNH hydrolase [Rugosimonospora africana]
MTRFVALGDSITVGVGDPQPNGAWRGWAELLAGALPDAELHNLAVNGALTGDVERNQLPRALALRPDVASVVVGVNDTLRRSFDVARVAASIERTLGALRAEGAVVLTMRMPDPGRMFRLPDGLARPLARRIRAVNAVTDAAATRFGAVHVDIARHPATYERRMWSVDRLHPSERGHRLLARSFADLLGLPPARWPDAEPSNPPPTLTSELRWMATKGVRWVMDRSTDLVPYLCGMMIAEWWYGLRGLAHRLDDSMAREVTAALCTPLTRTRLAAWPDPMDVPLTNCDR